MKKWNNIPQNGTGKARSNGYACGQCAFGGTGTNENTLVDVVNPTGMWKAVKNETEVKNERIAHLKDGIAITKMLYWLRYTDKKRNLKSPFRINWRSFED